MLYISHGKIKYLRGWDTVEKTDQVIVQLEECLRKQSVQSKINIVSHYIKPTLFPKVRNNTDLTYFKYGMNRE